jgi:hypothetical protein
MISEENEVRKPITFAFAMVLVFAGWLVAERKDIQTGVQLQTTFDFNDYPACGPTSKSNCIVAIQFYDAISHQILATTATAPGMKGRQVIVARAHASSFPQQVYAATVYLDNSGRSKQGPRGQTSEYEFRGEH